MASDTGERWDRRAVLAVVFGLVSVPWTYAFVREAGIAGLEWAWRRSRHAGDVPLWPAFIASAGVFAAGGGTRGLVRALPGLVLGALYGAATLAIVDAAGGGTVLLAVVVGAFMLLASLHAYVDALSFTPAAFLGYASLFGVNAAGATAFGVDGLAGVTGATLAAVVVGAQIGWGADRLSTRIA